MSLLTTTAERGQSAAVSGPPKRLASAKPWLIGVGAIGRQVALQLAALGVRG